MKRSLTEDNLLNLREEYSKIRKHIYPLVEDDFFGDDDKLMFEVYFRLLGTQNLTIVEIGSWMGMGSTRFIAERLDVSSVLYAIDPWDPKLADISTLREIMNGRNADYLYHQFLSNMRHLGLEDRVIPFRGKSIEVATDWNLPIDILFIDGDHSEKAILSDIAYWVPHVREGGIICGDDYHINRGFSNIIRRVLNNIGFNLDLEGNGVVAGVRQSIDDGIIKNVLFNYNHWWCVK